MFDEINWGAAGLAVLGGFIALVVQSKVEGVSLFIKIASFVATAVVSYLVASFIIER